MHRAIENVLSMKGTDMTGLSRRNAIMGTAVAIASGAGVALLAGEAHGEGCGDKYLLELWGEHERIEREYFDAVKLEDKLDSESPAWTWELPCVEINAEGGSPTMMINYESNIDAIEQDIMNCVIKRTCNDPAIVGAVSNFIDGKRAELKRQQKRLTDYEAFSGKAAVVRRKEKLDAQQIATHGEIADEPASGMVGLGVKAQLLRWCVGFGCECEELADSLAADVERLA